MKVRGDDTLERAHSLCHFLRQISSFSRYFLETVTETGSIHWVSEICLQGQICLILCYFLGALAEMVSIPLIGVQTCLQSSHECKRWRPPRGGSYVVPLFGANLPRFALLFGNTCRDGYNTLDRWTKGFEAAMNVRGDDHLKGSHSLCHFLGQICLVSRYFLGTLAERVSIHWIGVQSWLRSSHEYKRWWPPRGGSFFVPLFEANLLLFALLFGNT